MRTCAAVGIVTAASVATIAVLLTIGWQSARTGSDEIALKGGVGSAVPEDNVIRLSRRAADENAQDDSGESKPIEEGGGKMETNRNRKQQRSESKMEEVKSPTAKKPKTPTYISLDGTWNIENRNRSRHYLSMQFNTDLFHYMRFLPRFLNLLPLSCQEILNISLN